MDRALCLSQVGAVVGKQKVSHYLSLATAHAEACVTSNCSVKGSNGDFFRATEVSRCYTLNTVSPGVLGAGRIKIVSASE